MFFCLVPLAPTNFNFAAVYPGILNTLVTFKWDEPCGQHPIIVNYYEIRINPAPVSHSIVNRISSAPWNVTLNYDVVYNVSITTVSCDGRSAPVTLQFSKTKKGS